MAIYNKLLEFQKQNITIKRDGTNPHFRKSYTTLNEVLEKVKKPLNDAGVVIVQSPEIRLAPVSNNKEHGLFTRLVDTEDGSEVSSFVPFIGATDMQKLGGAITYARRYSLVTLLGLEDEDDDGNAASAPKSMSTPQGRAVGAAQRPTGPVEAIGEPFEGNPFKPASSGVSNSASDDLESITID